MCAQGSTIAHAHTHTHIRIRIRAHTYTHTYAYARTHARTHAHTHTHRGSDISRRLMLVCVWVRTGIEVEEFTDLLQQLRWKRMEMMTMGLWQVCKP
jgi:hypothetical protein